MTQQTMNKHYYIKIGICPHCHKNRLFGEEKSCPECRAKSTEYALKRNRIEYNKNHAEWARKTYVERKSKGICVRCGKRRAINGETRCSICKGKDETTRNIRDSHLSRFERGLCRWCDNPVEKGFKVCEYHRLMNAAKSKKRGTENAEVSSTM